MSVSMDSARSGVSADEEEKDEDEEVRDAIVEAYVVYGMNVFE